MTEEYSNLESEETVPYKPSPPPPPSVAPPPPEGSDIGGGLGAALFPPPLLPHPQPAIGRPSGPTGQGASRPGKNITIQGDTSDCSLSSVEF